MAGAPEAWLSGADFEAGVHDLGEVDLTNALFGAGVTCVCLDSSGSGECDAAPWAVKRLADPSQPLDRYYLMFAMLNAEGAFELSLFGAEGDSAPAFNIPPQFAVSECVNAYFAYLEE